MVAVNCGEHETNQKCREIMRNLLDIGAGFDAAKEKRCTRVSVTIVRDYAEHSIAKWADIRINDKSYTAIVPEGSSWLDKILEAFAALNA